MSLMSLVRRSLRPLIQRPAYAFIMIIGLAIGIGANTSIFSLVNGVLLQPLPYPASDRLVTVWEDHTLRDGPKDEWTGYSTFRDWRSGAETFEAMAAYSGWAPNLGAEAGATPEQLTGMVVSHDWFRVLGTQPRLGRFFLEEEDNDGAETVVVLSHSLWQRRFGGDPSWVGRTISLDEAPATVIGILPEDHETLLAGVEIWRTLGLSPSGSDRGNYFLQVVGRLKPEVELQRAEADLERVTSAIALEHPAEYEGVEITLIPLQDRLVGAAKPAILALAGAVGLLLLVTCVNVANLLLVSAIGRQQELAIRAGLGASRGRLIGRLLAESSVLAAIGGLAGLVLASWGTRFLVAMAPAGTPRIHEVTLNPTVAAFAVGLSVFTGLGFGILPAIRASRIDLAQTLRPGGRVESEKQGRLRSALVVAETALALCLLVGAGLLAKSFWTVTRVDVGFQADGVVSSTVVLPTARYEERQERVVFFDKLVHAIEARPEISAAAGATSVPLSGSGSDFSYYVEGAPIPEPGRGPAAWYRMVTPSYFETLGIQVLKGEPFNASHGLDTPKVIAVSERFAKRWFGDSEALGKRMKLGGHDSDRDWMTIVAVVADVRDRSPMLPTRDDVYLAHSQWGNARLTLAVKSLAGPESATTAIQAELERLDPSLSASQATLLSESLSDTLWLPRLAGQVLSAFALAALILAALGLYGVLSQTVQMRRKEMGIRSALGAARKDIIGLVLRQGLGLAAMGLVLGAVISVGLSSVMESLLHGVEPTDPQVFMVTAAVMMLAAGLAAWLPARQASEADPMVSLRED